MLSDFFQRAIEEILPSQQSFFQALTKKKKLTIYHGVDPTAPDLHLGHSTNHLVLRELQKMGHRIIILVGDFTARIGDPSGRTKERVPLSAEQVRENAKTYKKQLAKILNFRYTPNPPQIVFNSRWLARLALEDVIEITAHFTVQQMLSREMFEQRITTGNPIGLHEFLYPLMQGYDSVALAADAEVGGSDQLFNMLAGRDLVKSYLLKDKFVVTTRLLENPKTGQKLMSKSEGNYIALLDNPQDMYGKIMALPDEVIKSLLELCTPVSNAEIKKIMSLPPMQAKARLAREIVTMHHSTGKAETAERNFEKQFRAKKLPSRIPEVEVKEKKLSIIELLQKAGLSASKSEARRLIKQGGVKINGRRVDNPHKVIEIKKGTIIQVGKRRFKKAV